MPVWLHKALTNYYKGLPFGYFLLEGQNFCLGDGGISSLDKEGIRRCSRIGRGQISDGRCFWGGWIIRWGGLISKCRIKYGWWDIWGNWGWIFLKRMGLSVRLGRIGVDWGGLHCYLLEKLEFGALAALWEACQGSLQRRGWSGWGWYKWISGSGIMDWYWLVDSWYEAAGLYRFAPVRLEKLAYYALAGIMVEIVLILPGWDGRTMRTRWDRG